MRPTGQPEVIPVQAEKERDDIKHKEYTKKEGPARSHPEE
jgi:hypothetical protein